MLGEPSPCWPWRRASKPRMGTHSFSGVARESPLVRARAKPTRGLDGDRLHRAHDRGRRGRRGRRRRLRLRCRRARDVSAVCSAVLKDTARRTSRPARTVSIPTASVVPAKATHPRRRCRRASMSAGIHHRPTSAATGLGRLRIGPKSERDRERATSRTAASRALPTTDDRISRRREYTSCSFPLR